MGKIVSHRPIRGGEPINIQNPITKNMIRHPDHSSRLAGCVPNNTHSAKNSDSSLLPMPVWELNYPILPRLGKIKILP